MVGHPLAAGLATIVTAADLAPLAPIADVRASAEYRLEAASELVRRSILACVK